MFPVAVVWHWWLSLIMALASIGLVVTMVVLYFIIVQKPKYPRKP